MTRFAFLGGAVCLDFVNTVAWRRSAREERLSSYGDLLEWAFQARLLTRREYRGLRQTAARRDRDARIVLMRARRFREALYRVCDAIAGRRTVGVADLAAVNEEVSLSRARMRMAARAEHFEWEWIGDDQALESVMCRVAKSAMELLTTGDLSRIRRCESTDGCGWLFVDASRNRSRRWCDMRDCGNRAKVRRYYRTHRGSRSRKPQPTS